MLNSTNHTARYQLDRFLNSEASWQYDLDAYDLALLNAICYYIDLEKDGRNACCAKQCVLADRSRMHRTEANERIQKLNKMGLIVCERRWKLVWITLGKNLIKSSVATRSSSPRLLDQVADDDTTIEEKKQNIREETTDDDSFILDEELMDVPKVDDFMRIFSCELE